MPAYCLHTHKKKITGGWVECNLKKASCMNLVTIDKLTLYFHVHAETLSSQN
jgi:hypothetical protein